MTDSLLFYIIKEFNNTYDMSGKIWCIKLLSGSLSVDDKIRLCGVKLVGKKEGYGYVDATVKEVRYEKEVPDIIKDSNFAAEGDIVTLNLKDCYANNGKKINKNDIVAGYTTIGIKKDAPFSSFSEINIKFTESLSFVEKLMVSLESRNEKQRLNKAPACAVKLLWLGRGISMGVTDALETKDAKDFVFSFGLHGAKELFVPDDETLKERFRRAIIKDRVFFAKQLSGNVYKYAYHTGTIIDF